MRELQGRPARQALRTGRADAIAAVESRVPDWTSALSTGWSSNFDRLMTLSTSAVAVCCSNDSLSSVVLTRSSFSSRAFSIAITD